ncbi:MAG: hypothetical protein OHK0022_45690 [Roseiflexaceae bacterium]
MTIDYDELLDLLSVPRPNGSAAERATLAALKRWLEARGIAYQTHGFRQYPYLYQAVGAWLIGSRALLALAVLRRWGWPALPIAGVGLAGGVLDTFGVPLVGWPGARRGESLLLEFGPPDADREIILAAHYDSKTELLGRNQAHFFISRLPLGIALSVLLGLLGPLDHWLARRRSPLAHLTYALGLAVSPILLGLASGLGLHLMLGRLVAPSQGAVDNGAACAILLGLAARLAGGQIPLQQTRVRIALFGAEEVNMQGSRAFVREQYRDGPTGRPVVAVNLELLGQDGGYLLWRKDGNALRSVDTSPEVNALVGGAVKQVTGQAPPVEGLLNSDTFSFLSAGIPAAVLGSFDAREGNSGMHSAADRRERVHVARLHETVAILEQTLLRYDALPAWLLPADLPQPEQRV